MRRLTTLIMAVLLWVSISWGQTVLISPTGDGGFENGTTFAANGWTESNSANNPWVVGTYVNTPPFVNRSAYVSNDGGATNSYTNTLSALNYIYRDVAIPAGQSTIILSFNWVCNGESSWDLIQVFAGPTSITPVGTTTYPGSGLSNVPSGIAGATFIGSLQLQTTIQSVTFFIPGSFAGTTMRLIFAWKDDTSGGTAPAGSIDNISLTSQTPVPLTGTYTIDPAGSGGSNFTTFAAAFTALNLNGAGSGGVTFNVADGAVFNETALNLSATGTAANPIIFQKSGTGTKPIINFTGTSGTTDFGFKLSGSDYITFNGLDIRDAGTSSSNYTEYGFYLSGGAADGCNNNTIKNCIIDLNKANTSSKGVYLSSAATTATGANSFNKFYNNTVQDAYNGYYFVGSSTIVDDNNEVNTMAGGTSLIDNLGNNLSTTLYGIYLNYQTNLTIANTTLSNMTAAAAIYGIYEGSGATNTMNIYSNEIKNLTGSSASYNVYGIYIGVGTTNNIYSNLVHTIVAPYTLYGIYIGGGTTNNVYKNSIYDINYSGASSYIAYGLSLAGGITNNAYNNFIYDIRAAAGTTGNPSVRGLNITGGTIDNIFYNTVYLNYISTSATNQSAALYSSTTPTLIDLRDNIFVNKTDVTTGAYAVANYRSSSTLTNLGPNTNNNLYYAGTPGTKNLVYYDLTNSDQTLATYKARVAPRETGSVTENPPFVSAVAPFNLHMQTTVATQCESGGVPVNSPIAISTDYDGNARNASFPDIGADEFAGIALDLTPPNISYTPLQNTSSLTNRTLTGNFTDPSGVPTTGSGLPTLYWRINAGAYTAVPATWVSGSTFTFTFGGGVLLGDIVSYYVVAQDMASTPNVGALPSTGASGFTYNPPACSTPPTTPYSYTIVGALCGNYNVGAGQAYATLTAAIADLNVKEITCPVTLTLTDASYSASETFPLTINSMAGSSAVNTVTIKPASGNSPVISGNSTTSILKLNGTQNLIIDGSNNGTTSRNLTITNTAASGTTAVVWIGSIGTGQGSSNDIIKNCNISNGFNIATSYGVFIGSNAGIGTAGVDNNNLTIQNNAISKCYYGIYSSGLATGMFTNLVLKNNVLGSTTATDYIGFYGIYLSGANAPLVKGNEIFNIISTLSINPAGIFLNGDLSNALVDGNLIHDLQNNNTGGYGIYGININAITVNGTEIVNNVIYNLNTINYSTSSTTWNPFGIRITAGTGHKVYHNTVNLTGTQFNSGTTGTLSACLLYTVSSITGTDVRDNIFTNNLVGMTGTKSYCVYVPAGTVFGTINYNDYFASGTFGVLGYLGVDYTTLAAWQSATTQDANSISVNPTYVSATDLHPTNLAMDNTGIYLSGYPADFSGTSRTNPPDMGAYEFGTNPVVITTVATGLNYNMVTGNGTINANGLTVSTYFDYGLTTSYGSTVAGNPASVTGSVPTSFNGILTGLTCSTTYHYRARGVTSGGVTSYGNDLTFTTTSGPAIDVTLPATNIASFSATLNGTVNPNCTATTVTFEYGETTAYGFTATASQSPINGNVVTPVSANISGLAINTLYHFRVKTENINGITYGADLNFTTGAAAPVVTTLAASNLGFFGARLNGTIDANNQNTTVTFEYGLTTSYGSSVSGIPGVVNGNTPTAVYADVTGLNYNTTYHFRCVGQNATGISYGTDMTFTTYCPIPEAAGMITGPTSVCQATTGNIYTVPAINYAYNGYVWTLPTGGTITAGAGTNSITVSYSNSATSGNVTVYGTSICGNGTPSSLAVTINPLPVPTVTGPSTACITHSYTYSTAAGMSGYVWTVSAGGQIMSGAGTNSINVKWNSAGAQFVTVTYISEFGCPAAAPTTYNVTVGNLTSPTIAGSNLLCLDEGYHVYTTETGYSNYIWTASAGGTIVSGQGTYQIEVNWTTPGDKTVTVNYANSYGCSANTPASFAVSVMTKPAIAGNISGTPEVCAQTHGVPYSVDPIPNALTYNWTVPYGVTIVEGANTNSIVVDFAPDAISGNIIVAGVNICGPGPASAPYEVTVNPIPPTPVVTADGDFLLHSSSPEGNQWYYEGAEIPGAVDQDYQATEEGFYWTIVTLNGCVSAESNHEQVIFTGLNDPQGGNFAIYPIPNDGKFTITAVIAGEENFTINIYNNLGVNVFEKKEFYVDGKAQQIVDLVNPSQGIYTIVLQGENHTIIRKVMVTK